MIRSRLFGLAIAILATWLPTLSVASGQSSAVSTSNAVAVVVISGRIDDVQRDAFMRRVASARSAGAKQLIVVIDTYGGLVSSALEMSRYIKRLDADGIRTTAFVRDKAISAGAMLAMACDEIVMQPSSVIGDCAPIMYRGDGRVEALPPVERAKAESPVLADFLDSAQQNHHDPRLATAMVVLGHHLRFVENAGGEKRIVSDEEFKSLANDGWKLVPGVIDPINSVDKLLTIHSNTATAIGLSKGEFATPEAFAQARGLNIVATLQPQLGESVVGWLSSWPARLILLIVFIISLKAAVSLPGHGGAEAVALISLGLLVGIPLLTGYATWLEVFLIIAGLALLALEIFIAPGVIVPGVVGILLMIVGLVMTFAGPEPGSRGVMPSTSGTIAALQRGLFVVTGGMICSLILWAWVTKYLTKIPYFNRLVLQPPGGDPTMMGALGADIVWPLVGQIGRATTDLKPGGSAEFRDDIHNDHRPVSVVTEGGFIRAGADVVVIESRGAFVVVRAHST